jgi:hypothetical protein
MQAVIYRLCEDHDPAWQYHSMPESIVGGGTTLEDAREQYRDALQFSLEKQSLPPIREYVEREADGIGIWIRTALGSPHQDSSFEEIARQITLYPDEDREFFYRHPSAGGDPVVVAGTPDDALHNIFDQMTTFDSLIVVMALRDGGGKRAVVWLVITGMQAGWDDRDNPPVNPTEMGLTPDSPLREVFKVAMRHFGNKPTPLLAPA